MQQNHLLAIYIPYTLSSGRFYQVAGLVYFTTEIPAADNESTEAVLFLKITGSTVSLPAVTGNAVL